LGVLRLSDDIISNWPGDRRVKPAEDQVWCALEGKVLLLQSATGIYFGLNAVGSVVWERLQGGCTVDELVRAVTDRYEAAEATVEADVAQLLTSLYAEGLIKVDESAG
jgi:hypothetical protein